MATTFCRVFNHSRRFPLDDGRELVVQYEGEDYGWGAYIPGDGKRLTTGGTPFGAIVKCRGPWDGVPPWVRKASDDLLRELSEAPRYACDCCDHVTLLNPGSYEICLVCGWEDDRADADRGRGGPEAASGPNHISLSQAQANFAAFGAAKERSVTTVRNPRPEERPPGAA